MNPKLEIEPKRRRAPGDPLPVPPAFPNIDDEQARRMALVAKALADPIRLQLLDVLQVHGGKVCVCELAPLFDVGQPTVSHHLKVLREAGLVDSVRRGLWVYYYVVPTALDEFAGWLPIGASSSKRKSKPGGRGRKSKARSLKPAASTA